MRMVSCTRRLEPMISSRGKRPPPSLGTKRWLMTHRKESARRARSLLLLLGLEHAQDAIDGLAGIDGVQGAEHEVAGFSGAHGDLDRIPVAHLAHQNDLRGLAQGGAQPAGEMCQNRVPNSRWLNVALSCGWMNSTGSSSVMIWTGLRAIDLAQDGSQGGGFARSGRAGDQHQARLFLGNLADDLRELQRIKRWDGGVEFAAGRSSSCRAVRKY